VGALLAKAADAKLLRTSRLRADTTVVPADVAYPTDSGLLARAIRRIAVTGTRIGGCRWSDPHRGTGPQPGYETLCAEVADSITCLSRMR